MESQYESQSIQHDSLQHPEARDQNHYTGYVEGNAPYHTAYPNYYTPVYNPYTPYLAPTYSPYEIVPVQRGGHDDHGRHHPHHHPHHDSHHHHFPHHHHHGGHRRYHPYSGTFPLFFYPPFSPYDPAFPYPPFMYRRTDAPIYGEDGYGYGYESV
ncbi:hypothetical protein C2W64_03028 [Brevibacillus laterosporus]|nr:hypothetical protein C2W64_03028 [Brevibacillus laterosporus]